MSEELPPSLFNILRGDLRDTRGEINGRLDNLARDMVTSAMLAQVTSNQKERDDRQDSRIISLEQKLDDAEKESRRIAEEQRKARAQQFFAIGLAGFGIIATIISGVVVWSITSGLQQLIGG